MKAKTSIYHQKTTGKGKSAKVSREIITAGETIPGGTFSDEEIENLIRRKAIYDGAGSGGDDDQDECVDGVEVELTMDFDETLMDGDFLNGDYALPGNDQAQDNWLSLAAGDRVIVTPEQEALLKAAGLID